MFELAHSLNQSGHLRAILTGYPRNRVLKEGIEKEKISSHPMYQIAGYGIGKLPIEMKQVKSRIADLNIVHLDHCASRKIGDSHLISMSGLAAKTGKIVNARGNFFIVNRSSHHILGQAELLKQEYLKWNWDGELPSKLVIERELDEYENAFKIVVPSQLTKNTFLERGFSDEKVIVNRFPVTETENLKNTKHRTGILFVGHVSLQKGFPTLVKAFNSISDSSIVLHVAGVYSVKFLKHLTYMGLDLSKIHFYGPLNKQNLVKLYSSCEMFVLPSIQDGWGMVVNEALSYGCIPIVSDGAGASEIIVNGVNGFTFKAGNDRELLNCINQVSESKGTLSKSLTKLANKSSEQFNWDHFASLYLNLVK